MRKKQANSTSKKNSNNSFPIVAIGASAGGLEAVTELLKNISHDTGMAFVYIQHLDPTHESMLSTILSRESKMKVVEARHLLKVEPDHLYIIPPNKDMGIVGGELTLNQRKAKPNVHMPVDQFFISLAENRKENSIGVVLSGNANDGTLGLKAIKIAGGITFAQDNSAKFQSMPRSAISEGVVDMVLSPKEIAKELARISKQVDVIHQVMKDASNEVPDMEVDLKNIIQLLKKSTGVDFTHYKMSTIKRRIIRRMLLYKLETLKDYSVYLKQHSNEISVLYQDLLINVTSFFRDPNAIKYLQKTLLPKIIKNKSSIDPIRVWVPACSTGEEAYSLAIILMEILGEKIADIAIQIFATDLSEIAIAKARTGLYSKSELHEVSPKRLHRFFTKIDGSYRITKSIRDLCVFATHNIFKDPPFSRLDFISCCNLLIYLDSELQKKVIATFHYALNNNGYLMLSRSETIGTSAQLFTQVEKKYKIYAKKKEAGAKAMFEMYSRITEKEPREASTIMKTIQKDKSEVDLEKAVDEILHFNYTPACVVVNGELEILLFRGSTGLFLEPSLGKASLNLLKIARSGLGLELRNAIRKVNRSGERVKKYGLTIKYKGNIHHVSIEVLPLKSDGEERLFMIIFEEINQIPGTKISTTTLPKGKLLKKMQDELNAVREDMRSIIEEQEASNEKLQLANEEIVSSNEELQSINEELETSKEEVESTNEELITINSELQMRNEQIIEANEYSEVVFNTIHEPVLVLDQDLRVKTANGSFYRIFKVKEEETEGKLVYELGNRQWDIPKLREFLEQVLPRKTQFFGFEVKHNFQHIGEKVMLLHGRELIQKIHQRQLILLAFEDITEHNKAEKIIAERETWFHEMADNAPVMIWVANKNKRRTFVNKTWLAFTGPKLEKETSAGWTEEIHPDDIGDFIKIYNKSYDEKKPFQKESRLKRFDGDYRWILIIGKPTFSPEGKFTGYLGTCTEIHNQRLISEELEKRVNQRTYDLQKINKELERSNSELQQFAYVASHDLQEPLRKILTFSDHLHRFNEVLPEQGKNDIDKIAESAERMRRLIDDLLNFSRITRSNRKFVDTDLDKILKDVLVNFDLVISEKKADIKIEKLPVIQAIPVQMEQLFHNLLSNALKFSKAENSPTIKIFFRMLKTREKNRQIKSGTSVPYVEIVFEDNGIGFQNEFSKQIFNIFQRLNNKEQYPGTGIGLALCQRIVSNHGGEIYADGKENRGASFHIILPVEQKSVI